MQTRDDIPTPFPEETPEPSPEASPEATPISYEEQTLTALGNIEGFLIFFAVVLLCWLAYKFLRIFF